jgi:hypothetical protein
MVKISKDALLLRKKINRPAFKNSKIDIKDY